jgi:hypothetical protein
MMATGTPVTYQVTRITPDTQFPPGAQPVTGKAVAFTTSVGYSGSVFVPDSVFADQAAVRQLIEAEVKLVAAATMLSGTVQGS